MQMNDLAHNPFNGNQESIQSRGTNQQSWRISPKKIVGHSQQMNPPTSASFHNLQKPTYGYEGPLSLVSLANREPMLIPVESEDPTFFADSPG
jgi:hypothetical protein